MNHLPPKIYHLKSESNSCQAQLWLILILSLLFTWPTSGCGYNHYSYETIRAEYSSSICPAGNKEKQQATKTATCTIDTPLTIERTLDITLENNPDLVRAARRIEQAEAMLTLADAAFWPSVDAYTEYMQGDAPSAYLFKTIDQRRLPPDVNFNDPGWFENYESGLKAKMNLFNGGRDYLGIKMAEKELAASRMERREIENKLSSRAIKGFYNAAAARDFIRIAERSVLTVSEQLRVTKVHYEGGSAVKADVLSLEVRLARAREQLVKSRNRYHLALAALAHLMGLDPSTLMGKENVLTPNGIVPPEVPETYDAGLARALNRRPELATVRARLIKSRMGLDAARRAYLPSLDFRGKYYFDDPHMEYDADRKNWTAALILDWNLFSGFARAARVDRADAVVREMLAEDQKVTLGVKLDVQNAYLKREEARSRYRVAQNSVAAAEESFRLVSRHYKGGAVTITRYLEAELDRNRARIRSTSAYYDKIKATAEIGRAIGMWAVKTPQLNP